MYYEKRKENKTYRNPEISLEAVKRLDILLISNRKFNYNGFKMEKQYVNTQTQKLRHSLIKDLFRNLGIAL